MMALENCQTHGCTGEIAMGCWRKVHKEELHNLRGVNIHGTDETCVQSLVEMKEEPRLKGEHNTNKKFWEELVGC